MARSRKKLNQVDITPQVVNLSTILNPTVRLLLAVWINEHIGEKPLCEILKFKSYSGDYGNKFEDFVSKLIYGEDKDKLIGFDKNWTVGDGGRLYIKENGFIVDRTSFTNNGVAVCLKGFVPGDKTYGFIDDGSTIKRIENVLSIRFPVNNARTPLEKYVLIFEEDGGFTIVNEIIDGNTKKINWLLSSREMCSHTWYESNQGQLLC